MTSVPDEQLTRAIQAFGLRGVQAVQQELVERLRNGNPRGYPALRRLLDQIFDAPSPASDD